MWFQKISIRIPWKVIGNPERVGGVQKPKFLKESKPHKCKLEFPGGGGGGGAKKCSAGPVPSLHFIQSAICSLYSAFYTDRFFNKLKLSLTYL